MINSMSNTGESQPTIAIRIIKYWLPVAVMFALMFYFSTDKLSNDNTESFVAKLLAWLSSHTSHEVIAVVNYSIRKAAHFVEYAVLGALLYRAFRADDPVRWRMKWAAFTLASAACWAALDEFHQTFTRTRSASPYDSLLDSSGTLVVLIIIALINRRTGDSAPAVAGPELSSQ